MYRSSIVKPPSCRLGAVMCQVFTNRRTAARRETILVGDGTTLSEPNFEPQKPLMMMEWRRVMVVTFVHFIYQYPRHGW